MPAIADSIIPHRTRSRNKPYLTAAAKNLTQDITSLKSQPNPDTTRSIEKQRNVNKQIQKDKKSFILAQIDEQFSPPRDKWLGIRNME
eukprot:10495610-Karenia_brevis.AAC.1